MTDTPALSVECDEKGGKVVRNVYFTRLTPENIRKFYTKQLKYPTLFEKEVREDFNKFMNIFLGFGDNGELIGKGLLWHVDDFIGVFYITEITSDNEAQVHFTFFDGRIHGRNVLCKEMIRYVFERYNFNRLTAIIPTFVNETTHRFVQHIGFKREGCKRKASYYNGRYYDSIIYGILSTEALDNGSENQDGGRETNDAVGSGIHGLSGEPVGNSAG